LEKAIPVSVSIASRLVRCRSGSYARVEAAGPAAYAEAVEEILAREQAQWGQVVGEIKPTSPGA